MLKIRYPKSQMEPVVTVVYRNLPQYRIPFFEALRPYLRHRGIEFRLIYGQPGPWEETKKDTGHIAWGDQIHNWTINVGSRKLHWQPCLRLLKDSDLVIVEQASKLLINYVLLFKQRLGGPMVAFWGHGRNFQSYAASRMGEGLKRYLSRRVRWWFAYNGSGAAIVREIGFPAERITVVQNTIDTTWLRNKKLSTSEEELSTIRANLRLEGKNVAIFTGGLYEGRRTKFLIQAARGIRKLVPDFELIVVGAGPRAEVIGNNRLLCYGSPFGYH
jgi:glycosyltransferase involved in cell wall biosynthesis